MRQLITVTRFRLGLLTHHRHGQTYLENYLEIAQPTVIMANIRQCLLSLPAKLCQHACLKCCFWVRIKRRLFTVILVATLIVPVVFPSVFEIHRPNFLRGDDIQRVRRDPFGDNSTQRLPAEILRQSPAVQGASGDTKTIPVDPPCDKWSVVTATFPLSDGIKQQANLQGGWCMVIVGGKEAPPYNISQTHPNVVYLDGATQDMMSERYNFITYLPWGHVGRKNVGYIYAIDHGARLVWDFDDGVVLDINHHQSPTFPLISTKMVDVVLVPNTDETALFNPYPVMGAQHNPCWPRGLPPSAIKDPHSNPGTGYLDFIPLESIGVIQSLANQNPDVDDTCLSAMKLPFHFDRTRRNMVMVPRDSITPFNSQATLFYYQSLWMLALPISVTDRLSDIWRSFIAQRLAWELRNPQYVLLSPPMVNRALSSNRNSDSNNQTDLHKRSGILINFLRAWKPSSRDLKSMIEELSIALYERNFIERQDNVLIRHWLQALVTVGYSFPEVSECQEST